MYRQIAIQNKTVIKNTPKKVKIFDLFITEHTIKKKHYFFDVIMAIEIAKAIRGVIGGAILMEHIPLEDL